MQDSITVLSHATNKLAKTWRADGSVLAYDLAKLFNMREECVGDIHELSALLAKLNDEPRSCIIRGKRIDGATGKVHRRLDSFADQPLHTVLIEVDTFEPILADALHEPAEAAQEFITSCLPKPFHGASFHWQLSNSAGHPSKLGKLKAHLWFWLSEPATSAQLKKWALAADIDCDKAVFNPVQVHYTAAPVFEEGVADPVPVRFGFHQGTHDAVVVEMPEVVEGDRRVRQRGVVGERASDDPVAVVLYDRGMVLDDRTEGALHIVCPFDAEHSPGSAVSSTTYFLRDTGGFEQGHFKCLHDSCTGRGDADFLGALGLGVENDFDVVVHEATEVGAPCELPKLERDKSGRILATLGNLEAVLTRSDICGEHIRFDNFRDEIMYCPVGQPGQWRSFVDVDYTRLRAHLESQGFKPISREMIRDVVHRVADMQHFDTSIEWLDGLTWDGKPRVENFLRDYFGAADDDYTRSVALYMWTAMAGRVLAPGCKADMVPVLIGAQGVGKSYGVAELVPSFEFVETVDLMDRDADLARRMRGKLVIEFGELRGLHGRDMEGIKEFITRTYESWVPKYQEFAKKYPRRCVFIGTTNQEEFLADTTGNRRWLPVRCGTVRVDAVKKHREQLWAEARELFEVLGVCWSAAQEKATEVHDEHRMTDVWAEAIEQYLNTPDMDGVPPATRNFLLTRDILQGALGFDLRHVKRGDEMRVASLMREINYTRKSQRVDGVLTRVWVRG